jgi:hypothetical protein
MVPVLNIKVDYLTVKRKSCLPFNKQNSVTTFSLFPSLCLPYNIIEVNFIRPLSYTENTCSRVVGIDFVVAPCVSGYFRLSPFFIFFCFITVK